MGAWEAQEEPGWTVVRSLKRSLEGAGPRTWFRSLPKPSLCCNCWASCVRPCGIDLLEHSNLPRVEAGSLEVMLGVPANAHSNQRFLTAEAFRQAGFRVLGLLNEPSAASIEFGHRDRGSRQKNAKKQILVYDLGGGTFDASLVELDEAEQRIVASEGIGALGETISTKFWLSWLWNRRGSVRSSAKLFRKPRRFGFWKNAGPGRKVCTRTPGMFLSILGWCAKAGRPYPCKSPNSTSAVSRWCRRPYWLRKICLRHTDLAAADLPLRPVRQQNLEALYVTGGGSDLPMVGRMLREVFGRRVKRSAYTRSATAIGLAIQADTQAGYALRDKFSRHFGVWREADSGRRVIFDPLFAKGTPLPGPGEPPLVQSRQYTPAHNIGHFRYLECSQLTEDGRPAGDITVWDDIRFPFDPALRNHPTSVPLPVALLEPCLRRRGGGALRVTRAER